jgi:tRNA(Arg) A34 adenosine deaminase TadA
MISDSVLQLAIKTAKSSPSKKKIGAVLLRRNKVIVTATNLEKKTHPIQAFLAEKVGLDEKIYLHAEVNALIKSKEKSDTIVVARIGGHGHDELRMSKPCPICQMALEMNNVNRVIYSTNEGFLQQWR